MDNNTLKRLISSRSSESFVKDKLFDGTCYYFPNRYGHQYNEFRELLGKVFQVPHTCVGLVGSAKFGLSLSPRNPFRQFVFDGNQDNKSSDLDVVMISAPHFNDTWHHMRQAYYDGDVRMKTRHSAGIFNRFIQFDTENLENSNRLRVINLLMNDIQKKVATPMGISETINARIYASWTDAHAYHIWSVDELKAKL